MEDRKRDELGNQLAETDKPSAQAQLLRAKLTEMQDIMDTLEQNMIDVGRCPDEAMKRVTGPLKDKFIKQIEGPRGKYGEDGDMGLEQAFKEKLAEQKVVL